MFCYLYLYTGPCLPRESNLIHKKRARYKWYLLQPNFLNIDVNQKCSFLRGKIAQYSRVLVVIELVISGTRCIFSAITRKLGYYSCCCHGYSPSNVSPFLQRAFCVSELYENSSCSSGDFCDISEKASPSARCVCTT